MTNPIAPGSRPAPSTSMQWGANALTAPTTPERSLPAVDKTKVDPEKLQAAQGMEGLFLDYLMQVMRKTVPKEDFDMESPATEIYRSMMDSEIAQTASRAGGVGLADQMIAYWGAESYTGNEAQKEPHHGVQAVPGKVPTRSTEENQ